MFAILLPVKEFRRSKQRLAAALSPLRRERLARAMFEDVWETLRESAGRYRLLVVTAEPFVIERCQRQGVPVLVERESRGHSDAVAAATPWAMRQGASSLLSLAIDTPAITAQEISSIAERSQDYSVIVVPSADGSGTNALLRTPPDAIAPRFGPGSCALHVAEARSKQRSCLVHAVASFAADIDTPEDAERFLALRRGKRTAALLRRWLKDAPAAGRGVAVCS
ncbi:MAG TPA: 2-phospho-L-lactate guanylyltransferase [Terriglobia bacterium]|nr:2-phospho-L-lactate guanylyltransferase [Terriglobia bacterium]